MTLLDVPSPQSNVSDDHPVPPGTLKGQAVAVAVPPPAVSIANFDHAQVEPQVPDYMRGTYAWAYLWPSSVWLLDQPLVVNAILWGNYRRLIGAVFAEMRPGQRVYQPACVYGDFSNRVAEALGPDGHLDVGDVAPIQVDNCRRKLSQYDNARVHLWDAASRSTEVYDVVCCFFLLHEIPEDYKHRVVDALLGAVPPGGKVVFIDYHRPHWAHPLKWIMRFINNTLEPFAEALWDNEIVSYSSQKQDFAWSKQTYFGGLYQKVVAERQS